MLKITWEALPNTIIIIMFYLYIYIFVKIDVLEISVCLGEELADSESSINRKYSGVASILTVTLDKPRVMVPHGDIKQ